jgi:type II secretory pathway component PulM
MTKVTFHVEEGLLQALRAKAADTGQSLSTLVNDAMRQSLREDELDIRDFKKRERESNVSFESVLKDLKRVGNR